VVFRIFPKYSTPPFPKRKQAILEWLNLVSHTCHYMKAHWTILLVFICLCQLVHAQDNQLEFAIYQVKDGLSDNRVHDIVQDEQGFLWIATDNGLSRFDGKEFVNFSNLDSTHYIRRNTIYDICIGKDGRLYLGTDEGVDIFDPLNGQLQSILPGTEEEKGLLGSKVDALHLDKNNRLWVATDRGYSYQTSEDLQHFNYHFPLMSPDVFHHKNQLIYDFIEGQESPQHASRIFARASITQIWEMDEKGQRTQILPTPLLDQNESSSSPYDLNLDANGNLWAMNLETGAFKTNIYNEEHPQFVSQSFNKKLRSLCNWKTCINAQNENEIWLGGINHLARYFPKEDRYENLTSHLFELHGSAQMRVYKLFNDRQGNIWVSTGAGVIKISRKPKLFENYLEGIAMRALEAGEAGELFVGRNYSVDIFKPATQELQLFPANNFVNEGDSVFWLDPSCLVYRDQTLWVRGNASYNFAKAKYKERPTESWFDYVHIIDSDGLGWIGGAHLLMNYKEEQDTFVKYEDPKLPLNELDITCIYEGNDQRIWLGTDHGLFQLDKKKGVQKHYNPALLSKSEDLTDVPILALWEDHFDRLWIATLGGGLSCLDLKTEQFSRFTTLDGLPSNNVFGLIAEGDSCIWLSTSNGLSRYNLEQNLFINFSKEDGLLNEIYAKYSFAKGHDGQFFFGGSNGLDGFYPEKLLQQSVDTSSNLLLTHLSFFEGDEQTTQQYNYGLHELDKIELQHDDKFLALQFAWLNFDVRPQFSWRMDGLEKEWSLPSHNNKATYSSLPPGQYQLQVKATDGRGQWHPTPLSIPIIVNEAWYNTFWFRLLVLASVALLVFGISYAIFQTQLERRLAVERLRTKISSDLHDDVGSILTGLAMQSEILSHTTSNEKEKNRIDRIGEMSRSAMSRMRDTVWVLDARKDNWGSLKARMQEFLGETLEEKDIACNITFTNLDLEENIASDFRQTFYLIFKEAITNIIKHSNASKVNISLTGFHAKGGQGSPNDTTTNTRGKSITEMRIHDNGTKISKKVSAGLGLSNMQLRAKRIGAQLAIERGDGFCIILRK